MSVCSSSSAGRSTANSVLSQTPTTPTTPHTPPSFTDAASSDCEVSTLLTGRPHRNSNPHPVTTSTTPGGGVADRGHTDPHRSKETGGKGQVYASCGPATHHQPHHNPRQHSSSSSSVAGSSQQTPQLSGDQRSECGLTPFTAHSHSSTLDSGYTTNTEGDGDSTANSSHHHLSPPHSHPHPNSNSHSYHHHPHPHPHPHQGETPRGAGPPRNLSLAAARKFSSMHNVSSSQSHGHNHQHAQQERGGVREGGGGGGGTGWRDRAAALHGKGPAPMRVPHPADGAVVAQTGTERQRRSWDLAQSLDFKPVDGGGDSHVSDAPVCPDDLVVRPQANLPHTYHNHHQPSQHQYHLPHHQQQQQQQKRASPRWADGQGREDSHSKRTDRQNHKGKANPPPPLALPHPQPHPAMMNGASTLPGHWKYNHNSVTNSQQQPGSQQPETPTLFQLSQTLDLCSVRLSLPAGTSGGSLFTVGNLPVTVPCQHSPLLSPQGRCCARLGGPGSAFRPVRTGSGSGGGAVEVVMVAVTGLQVPCRDLCLIGDVRVGDVLLEVNGQQCQGLTEDEVRDVLDNRIGEGTELALTIGRVKDDGNKRVQQLETSLHQLELQVHKLSEELGKKDARIRELSTMLPWKRDEETNGDHVTLETEEGAFIISDNEFVV